jgi:hypothetical protein
VPVPETFDPTARSVDRSCTETVNRSRACNAACCMASVLLHGQCPVAVERMSSSATRNCSGSPPKGSIPDRDRCSRRPGGLRQCHHFQVRLTIPRERSATSVILVFTGLGALLSVLGLLAWRYATPLGSPVDVGIPPPPPRPMDDGKIGYMYIIDGYAYIDGPHWFPATVWFLIVGTAAALMTAALLVRTGWRLVHAAQGEPGERWPIVAALSAFCGLFGLAVSIAGRVAQPRIYSVVQSEPRDPQNPYPDSNIIHYDMGPTWMMFTGVGAAAGLIVGTMLLLANLRAAHTDGGAQELAS